MKHLLRHAPFLRSLDAAFVSVNQPADLRRELRRRVLHEGVRPFRRQVAIGSVQHSMLVAAVEPADILPPVVKRILAEHFHELIFKTNRMFKHGECTEMRMLLKIQEIQIVPVFFCNPHQLVRILFIFLLVFPLELCKDRFSPPDVRHKMDAVAEEKGKFLFVVSAEGFVAEIFGAEPFDVDRASALRLCLEMRAVIGRRKHRPVLIRHAAVRGQIPHHKCRLLQVLPAIQQCVRNSEMNHP